MLLATPVIVRVTVPAAVGGGGLDARRAEGVVGADEVGERGRAAGSRHAGPRELPPLSHSGMFDQTDTGIVESRLAAPGRRRRRAGRAVAHPRGLKQRERELCVADASDAERGPEVDGSGAVRQLGLGGERLQRIEAGRQVCGREGREPVGLQADPLMETSWHSWALVELEKSRLLSAVLAPHCSGVGVAPQFSWATWFATASFQIASHWAAVRDAVMTLDVVSRPPDAVMSWLTVASVLANPVYPAEVMLSRCSQCAQAPR